MKIRKILKNKENDRNISNISIDNDSIIIDNAISSDSDKIDSATNTSTVFEVENKNFEVFQNDSQIEVQAEVKEEAKKSESSIVNVNKNTIEQSRFVISIYASLLNSVCAIISKNENYQALSEQDKEELAKLFLQAYPEWSVSPKTTFWVAIATTTASNLYVAYKNRKNI
jgi:hypothetical protein